MDTTAAHLRALVCVQTANEVDETATICGDVLLAARTEAAHLTVHSAPLSHDGMLRAKAMLELISYCYVKGIFDSSQIERRLWLDLRFLTTFGHNPPTAQSIRGFRRRYRGAILKTIEQALKSFRRRQSAGQLTGGNSAMEITEVNQESIHIEAVGLLDMANMMDQLNADE